MEVCNRRESESRFVSDGQWRGGFWALPPRTVRPSLAPGSSATPTGCPLRSNEYLVVLCWFQVYSTSLHALLGAQDTTTHGERCARRGPLSVQTECQLLLPTTGHYWGYLLVTSPLEQPSQLAGRRADLGPTLGHTGARMLPKPNLQAGIAPIRSSHRDLPALRRIKNRQNANTPGII